MTPEGFYQAEAERLRQQWEQGDFRAVAEAFVLLSWREPPFPDWLHAAILDALAFTFDHRGDGTAARRRDKHQRRHDWAELWLRARDQLPHYGHLATREGAFAMTAEMLKDNVTAEAVERSYERVKKAAKRPQNG